jgi:hypothetical protein
MPQFSQLCTVIVTGGANAGCIGYNQRQTNKMVFVRLDLSEGMIGMPVMIHKKHLDESHGTPVFKGESVIIVYEASPHRFRTGIAVDVEGHPDVVHVRFHRDDEATGMLLIDGVVPGPGTAPTLVTPKVYVKAYTYLTHEEALL